MSDPGRVGIRKMARHGVADRHLARAERAEGHKHDRTARKHLIAAGLTDWRAASEQPRA